MRNVLKLSLVVLAGIILAACNPLSKPPKSGLQVITNQTPSSVFLNDQYLEKTPFIQKNIQPGTYSLRIEPDDPSLVPYETSVTLHDSLLTVVTWKPGTRPELSGGVIYEMEPLSNKNATEISFVSIPDGAIIKMNETETHFAPAIVKDVPTGHVEFTATLPSYETQQHTLNVVPGYRMLVTIKLAKLSDGTPMPGSDSGSQPETTISASPQPEAPSTASAAVSTPYVTILSTNYFQDGEEVLRVRSAPGIGGIEIGNAPVGNTYPYLGTGESGWYEIRFNNQSGWVSNLYAEVTEQ